MLVGEFEPETWPVRFLALVSMLLESVEDRPAQARPYEVNVWMALVTGVLELLKPDLRQPECLALMSVSANDLWQFQAAARIGLDPTIPERLRAAYPQWITAEELLVEFDEWAQSQRSQGMAR